MTRIVWCCVFFALGCGVDKPSAHPAVEAPRVEEPAKKKPVEEEPGQRAEPRSGPGALEIGEARPLTRGSVFRQAPPAASTSASLRNFVLLPASLPPTEKKSERFVALDDHAPRAFPDKGLRVTSLLNEDEEIAPGPHRLVAFTEGAEGTTFEVRFFSVDVAEPAAPTAGCVLARPAGTYNGEARADALDVRVLSLDPSVEKVVLTWTGPRGIGEEKSSLEAPASAVVRIGGQKSGDYEVVASCRSASGEELERVVRVVTLNRDAPLPKAEKP